MFCFFLAFSVGFFLCVFIILCSPSPPPMSIAADTTFPVILYNGQKLVNAGHVKINPSDNYSSFNSIIGSLINVSPGYIKSYLIDTAVPGATSPMGYTWKATMSPWTDFSLVCQQKDCCFLVFVKPQFVDRQDPMKASSYVNWVKEWVAETQRRKVVEIEQSRRKNKNVNASEIQQRSSPKLIPCRSVCDKCDIAAPGADEFHHCKLDAIVLDGYRTKFGPIGPPRIVSEPEIDKLDVNSNGLYSLFGPMQGVDNILHELRQSIASYD